MSRDEIIPLKTSLLNGLPALLMPIIIVGGIVFGLMTPTEAASVAVFAAAFAGWYYRSLSFHAVLESFRRTAMLSGSIFMILAAVAALGHIASLERLPEAIAALVSNLGLSPLGYLLVLNVLFILVGMVLDIPVALALLVPLLAPAAIAQGIDAVHLGIVICYNLCIGLITPPLGGCLLVVSTVTNTNYWKLARAVMPFVVIEIFVLLLLILVPDIALAIPRAMGLVN